MPSTHRISKNKKKEIVIFFFIPSYSYEFRLNDAIRKLLWATQPLALRHSVLSFNEMRKSLR